MVRRSLVALLLVAMVRAQGTQPDREMPRIDKHNENYPTGGASIGLAYDQL